MSRSARGAVVLAWVLVCSTLPSASLAADWDGTWENELGSYMTISVSSSGEVSGSYVNQASGYGCQGTPYPITGWALGDLISFSVQWDNSYENCNSLTGWTGYYQSSSSEIIAPWTLVYLDSSGNPALATGQDQFSKISKKESLFVPEKGMD